MNQTDIENVEVTYTQVFADEENPLIKTTDHLAAIEVVATSLEREEVNEKIEEEPSDVLTSEEYVFNEITPNISNIEVIDHEQVNAEDEQQIQFEFDLPFSSPTAQGEPVNAEEGKEIEVEPTVFKLETEEVNSPSFDAETQCEENDESLQLKTIAEGCEENESISVIASDTTNPFDQSIQESINLQNEKRKAQLKQFNYTFKNNISRIEEMERQPAYKRLGFELDSTPEDESPSSLSLDNDSNDDIQLRSNNSFLHDNVD